MKYRLQTSQETVRLLLQQIDPVSVQNRRRHRLARRTYISLGPNYCWHIDGYDKLRPYGFLISGCIDGFSRRIMWLRCAHTNHDPAVIAGYFLDCVQTIGGVPHGCRTDCGTENTLLATMQTVMCGRSNAHVYGSSPHNQRIEGWWAFYRRHRSQWWIELFEDLAECGAFRFGNMVHVECLRFCFMELIRNDLRVVAAFWNSHRIRPSAGARCPAGVPDELYFLIRRGATDCKHVCNIDNSWRSETRTVVNSCANETFEEWLNLILLGNRWRKPMNVEEAERLYLDLVALPDVQQVNL